MDNNTRQVLAANQEIASARTVEINTTAQGVKDNTLVKIGSTIGGAALGGLIIGKGLFGGNKLASVLGSVAGGLIFAKVGPEIVANFSKSATYAADAAKEKAENENGNAFTQGVDTVFGTVQNVFSNNMAARASYYKPSTALQAAQTDGSTPSAGSAGSGLDGTEVSI